MNAVWVVTCVLAVSPAADTRLASIKSQVDAFKFDKALAEVADAKQLPDLSRDQLITLFELEGIARATKGDAAGAKDAFARLLTLDPSHPASQDLPPKVRTLYFSARSLAEREPLKLTAEEATRIDGQVRLLSVRLARSSLLPATAVRWSVSVDGAAPVTTTQPLTEEPTASLAVNGRGVSWSATLLGARDAELATVAHEELPPLVVAPPPPPPVLLSAEPAPDWGRPVGLLIAGGGVGAAAVGVVLAVQAADARRQLTQPTTDANGAVTSLTEAKAKQLDTQATTGALAANVLMVGGGVLAAAGLTVFFVGPHGGPTVALAPAPGGIVASGSF